VLVRFAIAPFRARAPERAKLHGSALGEPRNRVVQLSRFGGPERPNGQSEAFPRTTWYGYLREFR